MSLPGLEAVEVGGRRIAYRRAGAGPPLVLVHGALEDSRAWRPQLEALSDAFDVVAWEAPGCGASPDPPEELDLPGFADVLAGFIEALGLEPAHVLGISFGSGLTLQLYERRPDLVRSLVLVGPYAGWGGSLPPEEVSRRVALAERDASRPAAEVAHGYLPSLLSEDSPPALADELLSMMSDARPHVLLIMARAFAAADLRPLLPRIAVPTLLVAGGGDRRSPAAVAERLHRSLPGARLVVIPRVGHVINLEAPEAFNRVVRDFLERA